MAKATGFVSDMHCHKRMMEQSGSWVIGLRVPHRHCTDTSDALNTLLDYSKAAEKNASELLKEG